MTDVSAAGAVPGWYPDPGNPAYMRYWDGSRWTEQLHGPPSAAGAAPTAAAGNGAAAHPAVPAPEVSSRSEVALSAEQANYLAQQASFGGSARRALGWAVNAPILLFVIGIGITRLVGAIPLIGWVLALYGFIFTVAATILGALAIPLLVPVMLPVAFFSKRPRINEDIGRGVALQLGGTFRVNEKAASYGTLTADDHDFDLDKSQLDALRPALAGDPEAQEHGLTGTVVHTPRSSILLAVYDSGGRRLIDATAGA